jgi:hypothetical protein
VVNGPIRRQFEEITVLDGYLLGLDPAMLLHIQLHPGSDHAAPVADCEKPHIGFVVASDNRG